MVSNTLYYDDEDDVLIVESTSPDFEEDGEEPLKRHAYNEINTKQDEPVSQRGKKITEVNAPRDWWIGKGVRPKLEPQRRALVLDFNRGWLHLAWVGKGLHQKPTALRRSYVTTCELTEFERQQLPKPNKKKRNDKCEQQASSSSETELERGISDRPSFLKEPDCLFEECTSFLATDGASSAGQPSTITMPAHSLLYTPTWRRSQSSKKQFSTDFTGIHSYTPRQSNDFPAWRTVPNMYDTASRYLLPPANCNVEDRKKISSATISTTSRARGVVSDTQWRIEREKFGGDKLPQKRPRGLNWNKHYSRWHAKCDDDAADNEEAKKSKVMKTMPQLVSFCASYVSSSNALSRQNNIQRRRHG